MNYTSQDMKKVNYAQRYLKKIKIFLSYRTTQPLALKWTI